MATVQFKSDKSDVVAAIETVKAIAKETKQDLGSLLIAMVSAYQSAQNVADNDSQLPDSEELEVLQAVATGVSRADLLKTGLLSQARKVNSQAGKLEALRNDPSVEALKASTIKGSATINIDNCVRELMSHNDKQIDIDKKWFISASTISNLSNSNMVAIKGYIVSNQSEIDSHHAKHGLTLETNTKRSRKFRSVVKDVRG